MQNQEQWWKKPKTMKKNDRILNVIPSRETYRRLAFLKMRLMADMLQKLQYSQVKDLREDWWDIGIRRILDPV